MHREDAQPNEDINKRLAHMRGPPSIALASAAQNRNSNRGHGRGNDNGGPRRSYYSNKKWYRNKDKADSSSNNAARSQQHKKPQVQRPSNKVGDGSILQLSKPYIDKPQTQTQAQAQTHRPPRPRAKIPEQIRDSVVVAQPPPPPSTIIDSNTQPQPPPASASTPEPEPENAKKRKRRDRGPHYPKSPYTTKPLELVLPPAKRPHIGVPRPAAGPLPTPTPTPNLLPIPLKVITDHPQLPQNSNPPLPPSQTNNTASHVSRSQIRVKLEKLSPDPISISPTTDTDTDQPSRKLVTSACALYPLPINCRRDNIHYVQNRQTLVTKERAALKEKGLKATRVLFR
ncbi:hypothetical protein H0H93_014394, partial [Arthromyces matolae]